MAEQTTPRATRFIGKGKYDKKFHLLQIHVGIPKRICNWQRIEGVVVEGNNITCENCLVRQYDDIVEV